jgi:hypothetical protein
MQMLAVPASFIAFFSWADICINYSDSNCLVVNILNGISLVKLCHPLQLRLDSGVFPPSCSPLNAGPASNL